VDKKERIILEKCKKLEKYIRGTKAYEKAIPRTNINE